MVERPCTARNLAATPILDYGNPTVGFVSDELRPRHGNDRLFLQAAHRYVADMVRPVYTLNERQPASRTLLKGTGSCSQRMACLEAISRKGGVATRARALWISSKFWSPRFPALSFLMPKSILLIWPQFYLDAVWQDLDELYGPAMRLAGAANHRFSNDGESVFDAIDHVPVDFFGKTCHGSCSPVFDLSKFVLRDGGFFESRDEAFERLGSLHTTFRGRIFEFVFGGRNSAPPALH